jgi:hypothetical protein
VLELHAAAAKLGLLAVLKPPYATLRDVHQRTVGRAKTSIFSLLLQPPESGVQLSPPVPVEKAEMRPVVERLAKVWLEPFGRRSQGVEGA